MRIKNHGTKMNLTETGSGNVDWTQLGQYIVPCNGHCKDDPLGLGPW
jgi:hypothetical protein